MVFATFGIGWTLTIDSVTFLISFIGIMLLQYDEKMKVTNERYASYKDTVKGLRYLIGNRIQRFITFNHVILNFSPTAVVSWRLKEIARPLDEVEPIELAD